MDNSTIKVGDYAIIQRQGYTKLYKIKPKSTFTLGNFIIEPDNAIGEKYYQSFQLKLKKGTKRNYTLEKADKVESHEQVTVEKSGIDNRDIRDDCNSQKLTREEIEKLREETQSSTEILEKLISNSSSFNSKTEYSQEKYLKKKEKKYFDYVYFRHPTIRLLTQMYYRHDPQKVLGLRIDDLSQILSYANLQSEGNHVLYDSGTGGLVTAAILERIGAATTGQLVHMHPGNECQKNAVLAMQFPEELLNRYINVNLYSVLRWFYQKNNPEVPNLELDDEKLDGNKRKLGESDDGPPKKKPAWHGLNERACEILREKVDSIVIIAKEHPVSIVKELSQFLKPSRTIVVFNQLREPLVELFTHLRGEPNMQNIQLVNSFMREYQVLPDRTHPLVNMNSGGFILYAHKVNASS